MDLRLENIQKQFGDKWAVEIPSLIIRGGEFFTFVGPSGCGKSTTLNLIAGLDTPTSGTLHLGDRLLNPLPPHRRNVAFVFQSYALYPHRTVFENLSFPLEMAHPSREEIRKSVEEAAALLGLTPHLGKYPRQLSGGERQRVALGRAMVRKPELFLFDEPLSNLDGPLRAQMRRELKRLHQQLGTTFIYVTHDQDEALSLSDRVAVMQAGTIQQCGTPQKLYDSPQNQFVASFFGSPPMNYLPAQLDVSGARPIVRLKQLELALPGKLAATARTGPIALGVRPEHVAISRTKTSEGIFVTVVSSELHGGQIYLELEWAETAHRLTAVAPAGTGYEAGDRVRIEFEESKLYPFNSESGERLMDHEAMLKPE